MHHSKTGQVICPLHLYFKVLSYQQIKPFTFQLMDSKISLSAKCPTSEIRDNADKSLRNNIIFYAMQCY